MEYGQIQQYSISNTKKESIKNWTEHMIVIRDNFGIQPRYGVSLVGPKLSDHDSARWLISDEGCVHRVLCWRYIVKKLIINAKLSIPYRWHVLSTSYC